MMAQFERTFKFLGTRIIVRRYKRDDRSRFLAEAPGFDTIYGDSRPNVIDRMKRKIKEEYHANLQRDFDGHWNAGFAD